MNSNPKVSEFVRRAGRYLNADQTRTLVLTGNVYDLFYFRTGAKDDAGNFIPLPSLLAQGWRSQRIVITYQLNGPLVFANDEDKTVLRKAWSDFLGGVDENQKKIEKMLHPNRKEEEEVKPSFDSQLEILIGKPTAALEFLRQLCICSRNAHLEKNLVIIIEGADMIFPEGEVARLSDADRARINLMQKWLCDQAFMGSKDSVVLVAESKSLLNHRVAKLPQVISIDVPSPDLEERKLFIRWFNEQLSEENKLRLWGSQEALAKLSAGLPIHALQQLLRGSVHSKRKLERKSVVCKLQEFILDQLGEDVVEFKMPTHSMKDVVGFEGLKKFLKGEFIPRIRSTGKEALPGAAVSGPIGAGKSFIFEAVAGELGIVVLVLKGIRSQWFGQTDVMLERLKRILVAIGQALIFVDEADTQFGGVGKDVHETEKRLTGKIQAMMSDPQLRGKVTWLLITARIHLLSPDMRRPGRAGSLIIPVLDPDDEGRKAFIKWMIEPVIKGEYDLEKLLEVTKGFYSAIYSELRSDLLAKAKDNGDSLSFEEILAVIDDRLPPAIDLTREYQTLMALINCTRKSLLPDPKVSEDTRRGWQTRIRELELLGIN